MRTEKGSFTVEISLIMTLLIPLLTALIYTGFYMHDRAFLAGAALETAVTASLHAGERDQIQSAEAKKKEFLSGRLLGTKGVTGSVSIGENSVTVSFSGSFPVPGMLRLFFGSGTLPVKAESQLELRNPKKTVNRIHGVRKLLKEGGALDGSDLSAG